MRTRATLIAVVVLMYATQGCSPNSSKIYVDQRQAQALLDQLAFEAVRDGQPFDLTNAVAQLIRLEGPRLFKCAEEGPWMNICPNTSEWTNISFPSTNVAIFSPDVVFSPSLQSVLSH
jgi:hypothetical protein